MGKSLESKFFWLLAILVAAVVFAVGINRDKTYQAEIRILILPKNEVMAGSIDQVIENAREIPRSLSFYDRLVEANPGAEESIMGLPDPERRKAWNQMIQIKRSGQSGMVNIIARSDDQSQAENLSLRVTNDLAKVMGKYYDIPAEIEIKNVEGPIVYIVSRSKLLPWAIFSLFAGFVTSLIIFSFFNLSSEKAPAKKISDKPAVSLKGLGRFDFRKGARTADETRKASAPENLPIAEELHFQTAQSSQVGSRPPKKTDKEGSKPIETKHIHREATPDEVRERLNKLLKGI